MVLWIADDRRAAAVRLHRCALRHGIDSVVGALAVDVGAEALDQRLHRCAAEDHDDDRMDSAGLEHVRMARGDASA